MNKVESGYVLINKPSGPTSHNVINSLRKITGIRKIGHAGTLDPFASGLLIVAIGREATREISKFVKLDKQYLATLHLGTVTNTYDRTGMKLEVRSKKREEKNIENVLKKFIGRQKQVPPMFSAKKVNGKKLYELARKGIEVEREPVEIMIYELEIINYEWPFLKMKCHVSSGAYIRSLAHDIGEKLGCGAYLEELERTKVGDFEIGKAVKIDDLNKGDWEEYLKKDMAMLNAQYSTSI